MAWRPFTLGAAALLLVGAFPYVVATGGCTDTNPANDCLENAFAVTTRSVSLSQSNGNAGIESGELLPADMGNTVWWTFTAYAASTGAVSAHDSDHQAGVAVYELRDDGTLQLLDAASGWSSWSWAEFTCVAGHTYYLQAGGEEGQTGAVSVKGSVCQLGPEAPKAPTLSIAYGASRGSVALSWTPGPESGSRVTAWTLQRSTTTCASFADVATLAAGTLSHEDEGLAEGTAFCYRLRAESDAGPSPWSNLRASPPRGIATAPLFASAVGRIGQIDLSWAAPTFHGGSPVTGYRVYASSSADVWGALAGSTTGTSFSEAPLDPGVERFYRIVAVTALGESVAAQTSARSLAPPSAPVNVDASYDPALEVQVTWDAPDTDGGTPITRYLILRGPKGGELTEIGSVAGHIHRYNDQPSALRAYDYAVIAVNAYGPGPTSARACGEILPLPSTLGGC